MQTNTMRKITRRPMTSNTREIMRTIVMLKRLTLTLAEGIDYNYAKPLHCTTKDILQLLDLLRLSPMIKGVRYDEHAQTLTMSLDCGLNNKAQLAIGGIAHATT